MTKKNCFVIIFTTIFTISSVDPPIKQGQTRYPFLVLQFDKDEEMSVHLNISEEDLEKEYENKLQAEMSGPTYEVISRVFKSLIKRKITVPGTFMGASGTKNRFLSQKQKDDMGIWACGMIYFRILLFE